MKAVLQKSEEKMLKSIAALEKDYGAIRAGRANPHVLDKIMVDYYGTPTSLPSLAAVSVSEARVLVIQPWDKSALKLIEKAINESDLGIHPQNDGACIRLSFPQLTEERRQELSKQVRKYAENGKVAIRNIRRDAMDTFKTQKKRSEITDDDMKDIEKDMQDLTDKMCKEIDVLLEKKQKELMSV